jgi:hypothetical protein
MPNPNEEVPEPAGAPEPDTKEQDLTDEAADFITSQVLDKGATFFGG